MFSKLLKHDFKAQWGIFGVLSIAALCAGLLGSGMMALLLHLSENNSDDAATVMGILLSVLLLAGVIFAVVAYVTAVWILLIHRFYKQLFTDEGYLTFTLPVTAHQILLSKILNIVIWTLISGIVAFLSGLLILAPLLGYADEYITYSTIQEVFQELTGVFGDGYMVMQVFSALSSAVYSLVLPLVSITIGALVAKKHKILAAFGIYFGINMVISTLTGVLSIFTFVSDSLISYASDSFTYIFSTLIPALVNLALGIGGYFLMHYLVKNKLNLP